MKKCLALVTVILAVAGAGGQSIPASQSRVAGRFVAYNYGLWNTYPASISPATGSQTFTVLNSFVNLGDGRLISPYSTNAPLRIGTETVTPSAVSTCYVNDVRLGVCQITVTFTLSHTNSDKISSATFGLQEALNDAGNSGGGPVTVDSAWAGAGGTTAMVSAAIIPAGTSIEDVRNGTSSGSGTVSGQASGTIPLATATTVIGAQSHLDDGVTTPATITASEPFAVPSLSALGNIISGSATLPIAAPLSSVGTKCNYSPNAPQMPECYGAVGDRFSHPLSTITQLGKTNTTGWTLAQWQTIYPFATALTNEIDRLAFQLISTSRCNAAGAGVTINALNAYMFDTTWDVTNYSTQAPGGLQCTVRLDGGTPNSITHGAFFWNGPDATGVQTITSASGGSICSTNGCSMTLTGFDGGCQNVNIFVTLATGSSWTGATFLQESGGDSCTSAPTTATLSNGGSGSVTLTGATIGHYGATSMMRLANCQNCSLDNVSLWGGPLGLKPNGIDWHAGFNAVAVNTHNTMRNVWVGGTARVSPSIAPYDCFEWTGANANNDQMYLQNITAHSCYDSFIDPIQQSVLIQADTITSSDSTDAMFILNSNWMISNENGDRNPVTFRFTNGTGYVGVPAAGQGKFIMSNVHPEQDGQFIDIGTSNSLDINIEGGSFGGADVAGVSAITSASGGTICLTNGCTMTLSAFNGSCLNTTYTATLPTGGSWTSATFTSVQNGYRCTSTPTTATLSNGGTGTATLSGVTLAAPAWIDLHGSVAVSVTLDHFGLLSFNPANKIDLSTGGSATTKIFKATNTEGNVAFWCRSATSLTDVAGNLLTTGLDSAGMRSQIQINGIRADSDWCNIQYGSGNPAPVIADKMNSVRGSGANFVKSGNLSYTLSGDYNNSIDWFIDTQNGSASFKTPAHRWDWNVTGVEASPDTGSGSTLCLNKQIAAGSLTNVMCFDRTTGAVSIAASLTINAKTPAVVIATGSLALATSAIASAACQTVSDGSVNSATATGVVSTDAVNFTPNGSITAVTGFTPATTGGLTVTAYPKSGFVNFDVCNWSAGSITPGAVTVNWRVSR